MKHGELLKERLKAQDADGAVAAAKAAFADASAAEEDLAMVAGIVYEAGLSPAFEVLPRFCDRFPESLHIIRAYLANLLERMGDFDAASDEARRYLCLVRDSTAWPVLHETGLIETGVAGSFAVLTVAYRKIGARSYCLRVLDWALKQSMSEAGKNVVRQEAAAIHGELADPAAAEVNRRWEEFFAGKGPIPPDLWETAQKAAPGLSKRLELIEGNFKFNGDYRCDDAEILQQVYRMDDGAFLLK
jgi:hypothetical protein